MKPNGEARTLCFEKVKLELDGRLLVALDACIPSGEVLTVMGPSGSGKSSLLAYAAGFLAPEFTASGRVTLDGETVTDLPAYRRRLGLLFQDALLFPHMSVGENLAFGLDRQGAKDAADRRRMVEEALREAGLEGLFDRDPATLSGGQASRVALMRVLLSRPRALLLDEPFSRLDEQLRGQMRSFVFAEARRYCLPVLLVTHDRADAEAAGGRIVELSTGGAGG